MRITILLLILSIEATHIVAGEKSFGTNDIYLAARKCGPYALFLFLIASGHAEASLEELERLPVSRDGTSMQDMCIAAKRFHVDAEIRRYNTHDLDALPLPAVVQLRSGDTSLTPFHYGVIYKVDRENFYELDGTTGLKIVLPWSHFHWTGIAMSERTPMGRRIFSPRNTAIAVVCLLAIECWIIKLVGGRPSRSGRLRAKLAGNVNLSAK